MTSKRVKISQEPQRRIFYIGKHRNPYIGHFQVTKTRDFSNFHKFYINLRRILSCVATYDVKNASKNLRTLKKGFST